MRPRLPYVLGALLSSAFAILAGPALAVLDAARVLPVDVRDRAAPLLVVAGALCFTALCAALGAGARRRAMFSIALAACTLTAGAAARAAAERALPASFAGLPVVNAWPRIVVRDADDAPFDLRSLRGAPAVVVLFRGATCPYCRKQLRAIAAEAPRFARAGVRVVAISPDPSGPLARLRDELGPDVVLLSDEDERSNAGLCGGRTHCVVVVDAAGATVWAGVSESWSDVPAPEVLLQAAYRSQAIN